MNFFQIPKSNFPSILFLIIGVLLFIAVLRMPYGYYTFLRILVTGFSALLIYQNFRSGETNKSFWFYLYLLITIIFNPFIPIYLEREVWKIIDITIGILFCIIFYKLKVLENINNSENK